MDQRHKVVRILKVDREDRCTRLELDLLLSHHMLYKIFSLCYIAYGRENEVNDDEQASYKRDTQILRHS